MNRYDRFFNKVINNKTLVNCLNKLKSDVWINLSFKERKNIFVTIVDKIAEFYPELGMPKFDFVVLEEGQSGEDGEEGTYLNVNMIEEGNYFEILAAFVHELRHFYQRSACCLYKNDGVVHELFDENEIRDFGENIARSIFMVANNYIEADDISDIEYNLQPIEYDAENFSYEFMQRFSKMFLTDYEDVINCKGANLSFFKVKEISEGNKDNIIHFNKIYYLNYVDRVRENNIIFKREKKKYDEYMKLLNKMYYLNDEQIFSLLNPGLLYIYDGDTVMNLLNSYLEFNNSKTKIVKENDKYYYKELLFDIKEKSTYKLIEPLFLQIADEKIHRIVSVDVEELHTSVEKDVKLNLMKKCNFIKESEHPLLYRLQPSILYRDMFIRDEYLKLIRNVDLPYEEYNAFFGDFVTYIKKYDYIQLVKKAEILYGKEFEEIYAEMLDKMKSNINKGKKAI